MSDSNIDLDEATLYPHQLAVEYFCIYGLLGMTILFTATFTILFVAFMFGGGI